MAGRRFFRFQSDLKAVYFCNTIWTVSNYEWDPKKAASNLSKHGVSFGLAIDALDDPFVVTKANHTRGSQDVAKLEFIVTRPAGQARVLTPEKKAQLKDEEIDFSDDPETTEQDWTTAVRGNPSMRPKKVATARGYQTRLNVCLRRMMLERQRKAEGH